MAALAVLGVRPQTLYAYASRGQIGVMPDPQDLRRSLYRVEDIETLAIRRGRGRRVARIAESTMDWGEPVITTSISTIQHGTLIYRGRSATMLAAEATLEQAAELLWQATSPVVFPPVAAACDPWRHSRPLLRRANPSWGAAPSAFYATPPLRSALLPPAFAARRIGLRFTSESLPLGRSKQGTRSASAKRWFCSRTMSSTPLPSRRASRLPPAMRIAWAHRGRSRNGSLAAKTSLASVIRFTQMGIRGRRCCSTT